MTGEVKKPPVETLDSAPVVFIGECLGDAGGNWRRARLSRALAPGVELSL